MADLSHYLPVTDHAVGVRSLLREASPNAGRLSEWRNTQYLGEVAQPELLQRRDTYSTDRMGQIPERIAAFIAVVSRVGGVTYPDAVQHNQSDPRYVRQFQLLLSCPDSRVEAL